MNSTESDYLTCRRCAVSFPLSGSRPRRRSHMALSDYHLDVTLFLPRDWSNLPLDGSTLRGHTLTCKLEWVLGGNPSLSRQRKGRPSLGRNSNAYR